jgi:hypothetical protein
VTTSSLFIGAKIDRLVETKKIKKPQIFRKKVVDVHHNSSNIITHIDIFCKTKEDLI